jgi:hypothetical protein
MISKFFNVWKKASIVGLGIVYFFGSKGATLSIGTYGTV